MRTSGLPLGKTVHETSVRISPSFSRSGPEGESKPGKFNFWFGTGEGGVDLVGIEVRGRLDCCL